LAKPSRQGFGGAYYVDDAEIGKLGSCEIETWSSFAASGDRIAVFSGLRSESGMPQWSVISEVFALIGPRPNQPAVSKWAPLQPHEGDRLRSDLRPQSDRRGRTPTWRDASFALVLLSGLYVVLAAPASYGLGGYLAGLMRTRPSSREDADLGDGLHGLLVWALATLLTAVIGFATGGRRLSCDQVTRRWD
jgi:hypothetical protein